MKFVISATELKGLLRSIQALQSLSSASKDSLYCRFTVEDDNVMAESAFMGTYLKKKLDAKPLRPGTCGININTIAKIQLKSDVTVELNDTQDKLLFHGNKYNFEVKTDQITVGVVESTRPKNNLTLEVMLPTKLLVDATNTVAIKPSLKEDDLRLEFVIKQKDSDGILSVTGADYFTLARYLRKSADIKIKKPIKFVLKSSAIAAIMSEVKSERIGIGTECDQDGQVKQVMFISNEVTLLFPALMVPLSDAAALSAEVRSTTQEFSFTVLRKAFQDALTTIKAIHDGTNTMTLALKISCNEIIIASKTIEADADAEIEASDIKIQTGESCVVNLNERYLTELIKLSPSVLPLEIAGWSSESKLLTIRALRLDNGIIEYMMPQSIVVTEKTEQKSVRKRKTKDQDT